MEPKTKILSIAVSGIRQFSKSNMAAVVILDFSENCSYYIYDTTLDVFPGVENIGVEFKIKTPCWSSCEI